MRKRNEQSMRSRQMLRRATASVEMLEERQLLASVVINGDQGYANQTDTFRIDRSGTTGRIFMNGAGSPTATWDVTVSNTIQVNGAGGSDGVTIDYASGDPLGLSSFAFDGGAGTDSVTVTGSTSADTVSLAAGQVQFNSKAIGYANSESLVLNLGVGNDTLNAAGDTSVSTALFRVNVIASGTLRLASGAILPVFSDVDVAATGSFDLAGVSASIDEISGAGQITDNGAAATLSIGNGNGSSVFSGQLNNGTGALSLNKQGTGRIELAGSGSFSGSTFINGGLLRVSSAGSLGTVAGDTQVGGGTTLGILELIGGISIDEPITLYAKNANGSGIMPPSIINVSGINTITSTVYGSYGGTGYTLQSDGGTLNLIDGFSRTDSSAYHRPFQLRGTGTGNISGSVTTATSWGMSYWKMDAGTWNVQNNTTPGSMRVDAGKLIVNEISNGVLTVNGGTIQTSSNAFANEASGASLIPSFTIAGTTASPTGTIDLMNNSFVVDYTSGGTSPRANIEALIKAAYANGTWTGPGITSGSALSAAGSSTETAIGVAEGSDLYASFPGSFAGQSIDSSSVVSAYTLAGDANLDGVVNSADFNTLVANYGSTAGRWFKGDFNYDGKVSTLDFNDIAGNFGKAITFAEQPWIPVPAVNFSTISSSSFTDDELRYAKPLFYFSQVANSVVETGPTRGYIDISVWRAPSENQIYNARVLENHVAFAFFYATNRPWNPYYGSQPVRNRLEAIMDYWVSLQGPDGSWPEYSPTNYSLAPTSFGLRTMVRTLELLKDAPAIDPGVMTRTVNATLSGLRAMLATSTLLNQGNDYSNQYAAIYGTTLTFARLYPQYSDELLGYLRIREPEATSKHQSPAGFLYEAGGSDWAYSLGTEQTQLTSGWHEIRGTEFQADLVSEMQEFYQFEGYNLLKQPDGSGYFSNFGATSRTGGSFFSIGYNANPMTEFIPEARFLSRTAAEEAAALSSTRSTLVSSWGNWGALSVPNSSSFTPSPFIDIDRVGWRPTAAQRTASENALPYMASTSFNHQAVDSRRPIQFTYVRRPSYYAAFNTGNTVASIQRYGLGALWNPNLGTVLQTISNSDSSAWGTRASGATRVYEGASIAATFKVNGTTTTPYAGSHDLAAGNLAISYALGSAGTKTITYDDTGINVTVTHTGNFTEEFPLMRKPGETIIVLGNQVTFTRNGTTITIAFNAGVTAQVNSTSTTVGGLQVANVVLTATGSLSYRVSFS